MQTVHQHKIAEWLLEAPKLALNRSPFYWNYLDRPTDGMIMQTWQPSQQLGDQFASDGYVWMGPEHQFATTIEGVGELHIYEQSVGYAPGEPVATHARRRYRLITRNPNGPVANPDLWITHYYQADPQNRIASSAIPVDPNTNQIMNTRQYLQSQGQITIREFMLQDRSKWPRIAFPGSGAQKAQPYFNPIQNRVPQAMAYPTQQMTPGPAAKRARTHANQPHPAAQIAAPEVFDDEEDTSRGDMFDHTTPREVAQSRYVQNQEWLEQVYSPIPTQNITPVDLGLGLGGSLKQITNGIFETYNSTSHASDPSREYIGKLDEGKAEEFRKRVNEKIDADNKEIEKMKKRHAKQLAKLQKNAALVNAEKALRSAVNDPTSTGHEYWRLEGKLSSNDDEEEEAEKVAKETATAKVDDIVAALELSLGLHTAAVQELKRIQDGGFQESAPLPPPEVYEPMVSNTAAGSDLGQLSRRGSTHSSLLANDHDLDMGTAGGLLDQYHTGFSAATTPGNSYTPQHIPGLSAPPSNAASPMPYQSQPQQPEQQMLQPQAQQQQSADIEMGGMQPAADDGTVKTDTGEWVVVPPGGVSPPAPTPQTTQPPAQSAPASKPAPILPPGYGPGSAARTPVSAPAPRAPASQQTQPSPVQFPVQPAAQAPAAKPAPILPPGVSALQQQQQQVRSQLSSPAAAAPSPNVGIASPAPQGQETNASTPGFNTNAEPVDFSGLDDLDTAGFEEGMDLVDDSAFGEAFHGVEPRGHDEQGEGDSL